MSRFAKVFRAATVAVATAGGASSATAQLPAGPAPNCPPVPCYQPGQIAPNYNVMPGSPLPLPGMGTDPGLGTGTGTAPATPFEADSSLFAGGRDRGAGAGPTAALGGYIDNAVPLTQFRLRYDAAYGNNRPDRAEFFYAKCGCFRGLNPPQLDANGPPLPETGVDYQELTPYLEYAFNERFAAFASIPIRFINPQQNANEAGLSDVSFGAKYALLYDPCRVVTLQVRAITPSGGTFEGLGTGNWWVEPGLLFLRQHSPQWQTFGEVRGQFYAGRQSNFTGNVLRYGLGTSRIVAEGCWGFVAPVAEFVGWTVLGGRELTEIGDQSAYGDTIVNAKLGVRIGLGERLSVPGNFARSDIYIGYGRALTGEVWYKDMLRVEYRRFF